MDDLDLNSESAGADTKTGIPKHSLMFYYNNYHFQKKNNNLLSYFFKIKSLHRIRLLKTNIRR